MHAPFNQAYRAEWRPLGELHDLAAEWHDLAGRAVEPNVFYAPEFALAAMPVFGGGVGAVLIRSANGRLLGLFPAEQRGPLPMLAGWTHPYAPLGVPPVDRNEAEGVIAAWLDHLSHDPAMPARLLLPFLPEQGPFASALNAVLARSGRRSARLDAHHRALLAPSEQRAGYLDRAISDRRRKELRRQRRRLEEVAPVAFVPAQAEVAPALQDFLLIEASGWKGSANTAAVNHPGVRAFVESAVKGLAARGQARVDRLMLNGHAIAASVTLMSGGTAWFWKIAYSEGLARFSPGLQLTLELTESLLAEPAVTRVDSCATPNHPMIDPVWRERLPLCDLLIELKPAIIPFTLVQCGERVRRMSIRAAKRLRDRIKR